MSTESNRRSVVVGIFVLLGIIIFLAGVFVLGGQQKRFTSTIRIMALFKDVGGLKNGNNVWFSGVKIGTVKRISFVSSSQVEVDMNIEASSSQYIHKDATASISSDGLIGNKIVVITGGTVSHPEVEDGDRLRATEALSSDQIMSTLQENNNNLLKVTNDFKELVGNLRRGKGTVGAVLTDSIVAGNFKRAMQNLEAASTNTNRLTGSVAQYAGRLNTKGTLAYELVSDTAIFRRLNRSSQQFEAIASKGNTAVNTLNETTDNLNRASQKLNNPNSPLGILLSDQETANNLKSVVRNLNRSSVLLNEDLKAAQNNFLLRGFFKKQAKEREKQRADSLNNASRQPDSISTKP